MTGQPSTANKEHVVSFSAGVTSATAQALLGVCSGLANNGVEKVHLALSTLGGEVAAGFNLYEMLRAMPYELLTYNMGSVNSIGNVVFLAGERRYATRNATFMFHGVGFDVDGKMRMEEKFLRERLDSIGADHERIAAVIRERADFPDDEDVSDLFLEAATMNATQALNRGIVHEIRGLDLSQGVTVTQLVFQG